MTKLADFISGKTTRQLVGKVVDIKVEQDDMRVRQEIATKTLCRGLAMIVNNQHRILERLEDVESRLREIRKEKQL